MPRSEEPTNRRTPGTARPLIGRAESPSLHVMSLNLRNPSEHNPDRWADRRAPTAALLNTEWPTVLGTQEGYYHQVQEVAEDLPDSYDWIGTGREGGSRGEFMAIFYDTNRLRPVAFDHFWLSDTPDRIGSSTWGNQVVRMATWVRFSDQTTGAEFILLDTHLDHAVEEARIKGAELVRRVIDGFDPALPVIVTGDFNVPAERSVPYETLTGDGALLDAWTHAEQRLTEPYGTFHGYRPPVVGGDRIDWILVRPGIRVRSAAINTFTLNGATGSDHWPMQALIDLP